MSLMKYIVLLKDDGSVAAGKKILVEAKCIHTPSSVCF